MGDRHASSLGRPDQTSPPASSLFDTPSVRFNVSDVGAADRVFEPVLQCVSYNYSVEALRPQTMTWCYMDDESTGNYTTIASANLSSVTGQVMFESDPAFSLLPSHISQAEPGRGQVLLHPLAIDPGPRNKDVGEQPSNRLSPLGKPMVMRIYWEEGAKYSQSGVFTVARNPQDVAVEDVARWIRDQPGGERGLDQPVIQEARTNNINPAGQDGHISTAAIAGIVVGTILALFIGASILIWLLLRRRRRSERERKTACALENKKSRSSVDGKDVGPPPPSHDAEDVAREAPPGQTGGYDNGRLSPEAPEVADFEDERQHIPPSGVAHHLVEEGMTEAEIRRLEEEERQLDAEIARAGHR
ncbi:hypothetical protein CDD80_2933 [Ophiocordyceps camponoti-rufipedis]|uniref:Uncharacterized protein n=1 Tax=Ophiocordyceps camponoti-rufipedis TaxID=2004952 RepID=A0A2C5ZLB1_9HYPO|nr:hypothetical protein CDD80_2933 [Ophiocordyceps camponoti-rufipedis]